MTLLEADDRSEERLPEQVQPPPESGPDRPDWALGPGLIDTLWRHRLLITAATLLAGLIGFVLAGLEAPTYEATARLLLKDPAGAVFAQEDANQLDRESYAENERQRVLSRSVMTLAAERLGGDATAQGLGRRVDVETGDSGDVLLITAVARDPAAAEEAANAVGDAYQDTAEVRMQEQVNAAITLLDEQRSRLEDRLLESARQLAVDPTSPAALATVNTVTQQIAAIDERAVQMTVNGATFGTGVEVFETARVPEEPSAPQPAQTAVALALLTLVVSSVSAWWWAGRHLTVEDRMQPADLLLAPLLGVVPPFRRLRRTASGDPRRLFEEAPAVAEAHRMAATALMASLELPGAAVAVTSASRGGGATTVATGIAAAAAQDHRVLVIDADVRRRGSSRLLDADNDLGLTDVVAGEGSLLAVRQRVVLDGDTWMWFVPSGRLPWRSGHVMPAVRDDLLGARQVFSLTVIDTPAVLSYADTSSLGPLVDGLVLVVRRGVKVELLQDVRRRLDVVHTPILGYVFNDAPSRLIRFPRPPRRRGRRRKDSVRAYG